MRYLVMAQLHDTVVLYLQGRIVLHLVDILWKRSETLLLHGMEPLLTAVRALLHTGLVVE